MLELARLGIAARPGTALEEAEAAIERLGGDDRAEVVRMPEIGVSSTGIRRRVAAGRPIRHLVPEGVAGFDRGAGALQRERDQPRSQSPSGWTPKRAREADRRDRGLEEGGGRGRARHADLVGYTDFLIVATARNERQAKAIHDEVHLRLKREHGLLPANVEGESDGRWVLMDYLDCVLHVFVPELRERYRLEVLWAEAPRLELDLQALRDSA